MPADSSPHVRDSLPLFREGLLGVEEAASIQTHLQMCSDCRADWEAQLRRPPLRDQIRVEDLADLLPVGEKDEHASEEALWRMADVAAGPPPPKDVELWPHVLNCRPCYLALAKCRAALTSEVAVDEDSIREIALAAVDWWRATIQLNVFLAIVKKTLEPAPAQRPSRSEHTFRIRLGARSTMRMLSDVSATGVEGFERDTDEPFEIRRLFGEHHITVTLIPRDLVHEMFEIRLRIANDTRRTSPSGLRVVMRSADGEELADLPLGTDEISFGTLPLRQYDFELVDERINQLLGVIQLTPDQ